jgi:glyoxylase I family protein
MIVQRLSHIGICVSDLEKSIAFYRDVFGFRVLSDLAVKGTQASRLLELENVDFQAVYLERDDTRIELLCYQHPEFLAQETPRAMNLAGLTHLSFRVSNIQTLITAVEEAGGESLAHTLIENPDYQMKGVFVLDPDGLRIEVLEAPGDPALLPGM